VVASAGDLRGRWSIARLNVDTGQLTELVPAESDGPCCTFPQVSHDGTRLYYRRTVAATGGYAFIERRLASGAEREVFRGKFMRMPQVSPNGTTVASIEDAVASDGGGLVITPIDGGTPRVLKPAPGLGNLVAWTPDGKSVLVYAALVSDTSGGGTTRAVLAVPVAGGSPMQWTFGVPLANPIGVTVHPDGQRVAFMAGSQTQEIWSIDGLVPAATPQRR
jgi:Tol biopolymer transport system component